MTYSFPQAMTVAGEPWESVEIPIFSYQLVFPRSTLLIDTALDRAAAIPKFMVPLYDDAAFERVQAAMNQASLIVVTHEHADHIGGVLSHRDIKSLHAALRLTDIQLKHPDRAMPMKVPPAAFEGYQALSYQRYHALAPGVVLIAAAGHTPGSQMVFVQLADGRELLFLGDVVWRMRNIDLQRERPRWATALIREDRNAVFGQIKTLGELRRSEPAVAIVPGHDGPVITALTAAGLLHKGFQPPATATEMTLLALESGDAACYVALRDGSGTEHRYHGEFELCAGGTADASALVGKPVLAEIARERVQAESCQGDPACTDSQEVEYVRMIRPGS
jgi:glyoxylase-like metal-dependent hydrolase (beta-lactamase superfamily II)